MILIGFSVKECSWMISKLRDAINLMKSLSTYEHKEVQLSCNAGLTGFEEMSRLLLEMVTQEENKCLEVTRIQNLI